MIDKTHPEDFCQECKGENISWYADNELWNSVMPDDGGILCPKCFIEKDDAKGLKVILHCEKVQD